MTFITDPEHGLVFGTLNLLGRDSDGDPFWFETTAEDASFGNPAAVVRAITSFLMDGAIEATESYGNREMTLKINVCGEDSYALAQAEAALFAEVRRGRNTLVWTPPNLITGYGTPCVFDVVNSTLAFEFDDLNELYLQRIYTLTVKALPFARSEDLVSVTTDPPVGTTPVNMPVDDCSSTTGWTAAAASSHVTGLTFTASGGAINAYTTWNKSSIQRWVQLRRTGLSEDMTSTPLVRIKMTYSITGGGDAAGMFFTVNINGPAFTPVARDGDYYWFAPGVSTLTDVVVAAFGNFPNGYGGLVLNIYEIARTDSTSLSSVAGQRQQYVALPVSGSARAQGNLTVVSADSALGSVLVYTNRDLAGFQPDMRRRLRVSGGVPAETSDTSLVSQKSSPLSSAHQFLVPDVPPAGYLLVARIKHASAGTYSLSWSADVVPLTDPDNPYDGTTGQSGTQSVTLEAGVWTILPVAKMVLPTTTLIDGGETRITLSGPSGVLIDEAWLFDMDNGRLSHAELGTGTPDASGPYNELRLQAATLDSPAPTAVVLGDGSAQVGAGGMMRAFDAHEFVPDQMNVFVVTTGSVTTAMILEFYPSWFTHVVGE